MYSATSCLSSLNVLHWARSDITITLKKLSWSAAHSQSAGDYTLVVAELSSRQAREQGIVLHTLECLTVEIYRCKASLRSHNIGLQNPPERGLLLKIPMHIHFIQNRFAHQKIPTMGFCYYCNMKWYTKGYWKWSKAQQNKTCSCVTHFSVNYMVTEFQSLDITATYTRNRFLHSFFHCNCYIVLLLLFSCVIQYFKIINMIQQLG